MQCQHTNKYTRRPKHVSMWPPNAQTLANVTDAHVLSVTLRIFGGERGGRAMAKVKLTAEEKAAAAAEKKQE